MLTDNTATNSATTVPGRRNPGRRGKQTLLLTPEKCSVGRGQTVRHATGQTHPPVTDRGMTSEAADLATMDVAELTQLIEDAKAALAQKQRSPKTSWWKRQG